jgi:putative transposase
MFVAERFISNLVKRYGKHPVSTDGGTWYPQACRFLELRHHIHSPYVKSIIERTVQYIKDRTEGFDDYFPCRKSKCKLQHIQKWLNLFVSHYNNNLFSLLYRDNQPQLQLLTRPSSFMQPFMVSTGYSGRAQLS